MNEIKIARIVIGVVFALLVALTPKAKADDVQDGELVRCDQGKVRVCTYPDPTATPPWHVMYDGHGNPLYSCSETHEGGTDLRCVEITEVCEGAEARCADLHRRNSDHWEWNEAQCRCDYGRSATTPPSPPPNSGGGGSSGDGSGGGNTNATVIVQNCNAADFTELSAAEMDQIERDLQVVTEPRPLQLRATAVYSRLLECDDGSAEATSLINRAAQLIAKFEEPGHDYTNDLERIRETIAGLNDRPVVIEVQPAQNWCTDTHEGRWWCIAFPILLGVGAAIAIPLIYDAIEDDSADSATRYQYP